MKQSSVFLLSSVLQSIKVGITVQNTEGKIIYANQVAASMIGYGSVASLMKTSRQKVLKNFQIFDTAGNPFDINLLPGRLALRGKKNPHVVVQYLNAKTKSKRWAEIKASAVPNRNGKIEYVVNTFQDITKEKQEEENVDHFIATASHELKTPLASIKALNQIVEKHYNQGRVEKMTPFLTKIDEKVNELTKIINDFLDITKIRAGKLDFNPELFNFDEFVDQIIKDMKLITSTHKIKKNGKANVTLAADKSLIRQVFANIIRNAIKYSPDNKKILINLKTDKKKVTVSIQDFGIGIAKADQAHIFEPYYRGNKKYTGTTGGLGLGLYISSHIVNLHGGTMRVQSKEHKGSTFYFTIPINPKKILINNHF